MWEAMRLLIANKGLTGRAAGALGVFVELIENLAAATERLNTTIDRTERVMAMADPMFRTLDALLPQLEALVSTGNEVFRLLSNIPGVSRLNPFSGNTNPKER